jgi:hypothetical protein
VRPGRVRLKRLLAALACTVPLALAGGRTDEPC